MVSEKASMVSGKANKNKARAPHLVFAVQMNRKFNLLRKYIQRCNGRLHQLKKRMHSVTREVKALKKAGASHIQTVLKAGVPKSHKGPRKITSTTSTD
ncbi:hypothetical protein ACOMHN_047138 [Nucella lapillus]